MIPRISAAAARRIALAAQGFGRRRPEAVGTRSINAAFDRMGLLQIDSVNVFERSHYLPLFARLGGYDRALLDRLTLRGGAAHTEYWAHEAAFMRREDWALFRWRMRDYAHAFHADASGWFRAHAATVQWVRDELAASGPLAASEIEHEENRRSGPWWGWSEVKRSLEHLFRAGEVAIAGRTRFERRYGLAADVLPTEVLEREVPREDAIRELVRRAAKASGIGTAHDLADYYRLSLAETRAALAQLQDAGELIPVQVPGWEARGKPLAAWLHSAARVPRSIHSAGLLSPFDPVVWCRDRAQRMFGFHYRIEIYTPAARRRYGYYVLPVLLDDRLAARVDLKSDRRAGVLRAQSAWVEPGAPPDTAERLAALLREAASWQGLERVEASPVGTLGAQLQRALPSQSAG